MKLSADLEKQAADRWLNHGETLEQVRAWLGSEHKIAITPQALSLRIAKHKPPKTAAAAPAGKKTGRKVSAFDAHRARLSRLLKTVTEDALLERTGSNVEKVAKITTAWARLEESHREANKPSDPSVADLAALLAKA